MKRYWFIVAVLIFFASFSTQAQDRKSKSISHKQQVKKKVAVHKKSKRVYYGTASYYANKFRGRSTASGDAYKHKGNTAACNVLPIGTWIRVTNLKNKKSITVQVNDRMHPKSRRLVDLTKSGADRLGFTKSGIARVKVEVLSKKKQSA
jgi:rare lipoprotein A